MAEQISMLRHRRLTLRSALPGALAIAYSVMWIGGVGNYVLAGRPPLDAPWAASLFLALAGVLVVATSDRRDWASLFVAAAVGFSAEILGVRYGFIFSEYSYTSVLQPQLLGVPLVMLGAWMVLLAYIRQMLAPLALSTRIEATLAAAWMTAIDLVIDPLAANRLGYWRWVKSSAYYGIPLRNFAGWFVVSLVIFALIRRRWRDNPWARYVGLSIVLFFTAIALSFSLRLPGIIGIALCLIHLCLPLARSSHYPIAPSDGLSR